MPNAQTEFDARARFALVGREPDPCTLMVEGTMLVGSSPSAQLRVSSRLVSRLHAELEVTPDGLRIRDLGSTNGTRIDHVRIERAYARLGATIWFGDRSFVLEAGEPSKTALWPAPKYGSLIGRSVTMRRLFARLDMVARTDSTVLFLGETGTGKELLARSVHEASPRAPGPFVVVDCTSIPEALFESELFGHARGAFTGASSARVGALEAAHGGTLFLDEVGELPLAHQAKLLRALEGREVRRVGENTHRAFDVRVLAATHRDLPRLVSQGSFREDLYFRLAVVPLRVPPLRDRLDDVPELAAAFYRGARGGELPEEILGELARRPWLGNVRELRNFCQRLAALGAVETLAIESDPTPATGFPSVPLDRPYKEVRDEWLAHLEHEFLRGWLSRTGGNVSAVAEAMGLNRTYVHKMLRKHDVR
jgi:transcriptional regulator with GAF, ATPase, and Fis domain